MPLSKVGQEVMANMKARYGDKKGESVFYASKNAGKAGSEKWEKLKSYRFGGIVKKDGPAMLHKGEMVVPAAKEFGSEHFARIPEDESVMKPPRVDIEVPGEKANTMTNKLTKLKLIRSRLK